MNTQHQQAQDYQRVAQAIHYLEENWQQQPSLAEIAQAVHLSKHHFQRLFKRWAGISPTQFLSYLTLEYTKGQLAASRNLLDTTLDAGLSSPGRLHDLFVTFEAMTPGEYKRAGAGLTIRYGFHPTHFGETLMATTERGICAIRFVNGLDRNGLLNELQAEWPQAVMVADPAQTEILAEQVFGIAHSSTNHPFHLLLKGTNFQVQVWHALLKIPTGAVVSYGDVAVMMGKPKATRAVASAIAKNPIGVIIPCHRVINSVGKIHRYRWGTTRKKAILGWELCRHPQPNHHFSQP